MRVMGFAVGLYALGISAAQADMAISIADGDPLDRVMIVNLSECQTVAQAQLTIDFTGSAGGLVVDTVRGGVGTKDPFPVSVLRGDIALGTVADGTQVLDIAIGRLGPKETAIVTLDLDDTRSWTFGDRVTAEGGEIAGTLARLSRGAQRVEAVFGAGGSARLPFAKVDCEAAPDQAPPADELTVPMG